MRTSNFSRLAMGIVLCIGATALAAGPLPEPTLRKTPVSPLSAKWSDVRLSFLGQNTVVPALDAAILNARPMIPPTTTFSSVNGTVSGSTPIRCSAQTPPAPKPGQLTEPHCSTFDQGQLNSQCSVSNSNANGQCSAFVRNQIEACSAGRGSSTQQEPLQCSVMGSSNGSQCSAYGGGAANRTDSNCSAGLLASGGPACSVFSGSMNSQCSTLGTRSQCSAGGGQSTTTNATCSVYNGTADSPSSPGSHNQCSAMANTGTLDNKCSTYNNSSPDRPDTSQCSVMNSNPQATDQCSSYGSSGGGQNQCSVIAWPNPNPKTTSSQESCSVMGSQDSSGTCSAMADQSTSQCSVFNDASSQHFCSVSKGQDASCTSYSNSQAMCSVIPHPTEPRSSSRGTCSVKGGMTSQDSNVRECRGKSNSLTKQ